MRTIKRYSNRRLYDTAASRTLTHRELAELIRAGEQIRVIDNATGADITVEVLGRILVAESASWNEETNPADLFSRIIALGGDKTMSILKNTVLASIGAFEISKAKAEKVIDELIKKGELNKSDRKEAVMELLDKAEKSTSKVYDKVAKEATKAQKEIAKFTDQVKQYQVVKKDDMKKLEGKVDKLTKLVTKLEKQLSEKNAK